MTQKLTILRRVFYFVIFASLLLSGFTAGSVPAVYAEETSATNAQTDDPFGAVVNLNADQAAFGGGENVILHASVTNPHAKTIQVLKWYIPADGLEAPLLRVTRDGAPVPYIGPVFKRRAPTEEDYAVLQPGETVSGSLDLAAYYDLSASGNYTVTFDAQSDALYARQGKELLKMNGRLASNEVRVFIEGRSKPSLHAIMPEVVNGATSFTSCSSTRQNQLLTARNDASTYAADSAAYLNAGQQGNRYITWFGTYLLSRYSTAKSHFVNISSAMDNASVHFDCTCTDSGVYAYVYPSQPYKIYLCGAFWSAPGTGTDSKAGTLIHEMSHFTVVADTDDWVYGQQGARNLAINNPSQAVTNADNHEYFAENNPPAETPIGDTFEPDNSSAQATTINAGSQQIHSIVPATDVDWFKFQVNSLSSVVLETSGDPSYDTRMWLYNGSLNQLVFSDDEGEFQYSRISACLPAGTYYVKVDDFNNNNEIPAYALSLQTGSSCVSVNLATQQLGRFGLLSGSSTRFSVAGASNGPVQLSSTGSAKLVGAERIIYKVNGEFVSYTELMGLPSQHVDNAYWLPWYNNYGLDTQLRFANVSSATASVWVYIDGDEMEGSPFTLAPGASTRASFLGVNAGPVQIVSNQDIVAAERVIYKVNGAYTSYSEIMALPASQVNTTYWLPWYDNVTLDSQLRFANISDSTASVHIYVGGDEMQGSPFELAPGASTRASFDGINGGPVQIVSNQDIVAAERVILKVNNVPTSFSEMIALPQSQVQTTHWLPWYNNTGLQSQLVIGNVTGSTATVHVYIGGEEMAGSPFTVDGDSSVRKTYAANNGLVQVVSSQNVVVSESVIYRVNNVNISFSEMMALPHNQLSTTYWLPWYNNNGLDSQLRFGIP
jgi:peptidyl-Lys metalloendopeptidase